jgi:hypothetical protein
VPSANGQSGQGEQTWSMSRLPVSEIFGASSWRFARGLHRCFIPGKSQGVTSAWASEWTRFLSRVAMPVDSPAPGAGLEPARSSSSNGSFVCLKPLYSLSRIPIARRTAGGSLGRDVLCAVAMRIGSATDWPWHAMQSRAPTDGQQKSPRPYDDGARRFVHREATSAAPPLSARPSGPGRIRRTVFSKPDDSDRTKPGVLENRGKVRQAKSRRTPSETTLDPSNHFATTIRFVSTKSPASSR